MNTVLPPPPVGTLPLAITPLAPPATVLEAWSPPESPRLARDAYEPARPYFKPTSSDPGDVQRREDNPFATLRDDGSAARPRLVDAGEVKEHAPEPGDAELARLAAFEAQLFRGTGKLLDGARVGVLLLTHDAQDHRASRLPGLDEKALRSIALRLSRGEQVTSEESTAFWRLFTRNVSRSQLDVQAMVTRVLREAYVLSNEVMFDLAERLRRTNELRKATREELKVARSTLTAWAGLAEGDRATKPLRCLEVDFAQGILVPDTWDDEEVASALSQGQSVADGVTELAEAADSFYGASLLDERERFELEAATSGNDDHIKDSMGVIMKYLPELRAGDLEHFLGRALRRLEARNTDEDEIRELFRAMSPEQAVFMVSRGYDNDFFRFGGTDRIEFATIVNGKAIELGELFGLSPHDLLSDTQQSGRAYGAGEQVFGHGGGVAATVSSVKDLAWNTRTLDPIARADAERILRMSRTRSNSAASVIAAASAPTVQSSGIRAGMPRVVSTKAELGDYIEGLEDDLNSQGEDAQLQNVTLQEQLQRQQHTLQMLSSIARMLHDTAMAVVRKLND